MAKKSTTAVQTTTEANGQTKSQIVKDFKAANPNATPAEIAEALTKSGTKINAAHVSSILSRKSGGGGQTVERFKTNLKKAKDFLVKFKNPAEALKSIEQVGGFIDECGGSAAAAEAVRGYQDFLADLR